MGTDAATKTDAHTPGPWAICPNSFYENLTIVNSAGVEITTCIGDFSKETDEANAALIVRAVNAHDELLAALKDVLRVAVVTSVGCPDIVSICEAAEAAIAAAEGRAP